MNLKVFVIKFYGVLSSHLGGINRDAVEKNSLSLCLGKHSFDHSKKKIVSGQAVVITYYVGWPPLCKLPLKEK